MRGEDSMDSDVPGSSGPELREYTALLRRRWRLVGAGVLGGLVLATAGVLGLPSTYTSAAAVQVQPTGLGQFTGEQSGRLAGGVNLDTEAQVLVSERVSAAVAQTLADTGPGPAPAADELRERVEVSVPPNSNVLEIRYSAGSPQAAQAGAQAYADAYLDLRRAQAQDLVSSQLEALRAEQENRYEALAEVPGGDARSPGDTARADALRQEITDLGNGISPLSALQETVRPGTVITPAGLPERASSPVPALWLVGGAALGLVAGLLAAVVRDRLDPLLRDTEETARIGRLPVLLDLSAHPPRSSPDVRSPGLLADGEEGGQRVNEFAHLLRARVRLPDDLGVAAPGRGRTPGAGGPDGGTGAAEIAELSGLAESAGSADDRPGPGRVLLVAASTPGRAGAATAVNLAAALARTGSETLLVCTDPGADTVGELLGLPEGPGLAEALLEGEDPADLEVRPEAVPRLRVLRHGSPGLTAPVQGTAMTELVRLLRANAEYVVVSVAPVSERADAHALAGSADLLLPVVELGRTRRVDLDGLLTLADRFGVPVPGTAVLPPRPSPGPAPGTSAASGATAQDGTAGLEPDAASSDAADGPDPTGNETSEPAEPAPAGSADAANADGTDESPEPADAASGARR
ncbi:hypothetical protein ACFWTE_25090 [Nocardiopsis sp. NPDC058631]|uniref:hypothetical protein n=1 Tax=Nocardiopsis sp. NPDC058631 TaxID=3346566 RepID=UPI00365C7A4A